jgi:hypothetical protein
MLKGLIIVCNGPSILLLWHYAISIILSASCWTRGEIHSSQQKCVRQKKSWQLWCIIATPPPPPSFFLIYLQNRYLRKLRWTRKQLQSAQEFAEPGGQWPQAMQQWSADTVRLDADIQESNVNQEEKLARRDRKRIPGKDLRLNSQGDRRSD